MKLVSMLALSVGLALVPVAQAQVSCSQVTALIEAAMEDFDSITGEEVDGDVYAASFELDAANDCQITFDLSSTYACMWVYDSLEAASADYGLQSRALGDCLSDDWDRDTFAPDTEEAGFKQLDGLSYFQEDEDGGAITWVAYLEEHIDGDTHDWHVWVGVDYF